MIKGELTERVEQLVRERTPFVVATVIRARRPTSVRPGFSAVVLEDGTIEGFVGGQCAESSVRLHSLRAIETGEALLLRIVPADERQQTAGSADAPPEPIAPGDDPSAEPSGSRSLPADSIGDAVVERNPCLSGGSLEIFLEPQLPAPRVMVLGSTPIAEALATVSVAAGYDVARATYADARPDGGELAVVLASHGGEEERVLAQALTAGVPYVALVASATRGEAVRAALDVPDELKRKLHSPAGLAIGASTPEEIAVSILAEFISEHHAQPAPAAVKTAIDPVCSMEVAVTGETPYLDVDSERVFFCGPGCRGAYAVEHAAR
jgi:xanthine dehydrogenase accessory factor